MGKSRHFEFKVIKEHARELRGCRTDIRKTTMERINEQGNFRDINFYVNIQ